MKKIIIFLIGICLVCGTVKADTNHRWLVYWQMLSGSNSGITEISSDQQENVNLPDAVGDVGWSCGLSSVTAKPVARQLICTDGNVGTSVASICNTKQSVSNMYLWYRPSGSSAYQRLVFLELTCK